MANIYEGVMNYEPTKARGWRPEAVPRVWDTLWGEGPPVEEEEEVLKVIEPVTTNGVKWKDSKLKSLWDDLKKDFQKGFGEGQQQRAIDDALPWVNPDVRGRMAPPGFWNQVASAPVAGPSNWDDYTTYKDREDALHGQSYLTTTGAPVSPRAQSLTLDPPMTQIAESQLASPTQFVPQFDLNYETNIPGVPQQTSLPLTQPSTSWQPQFDLNYETTMPTPNLFQQQSNITVSPEEVQTFVGGNVLPDGQVVLANEEILPGSTQPNSYNIWGDFGSSFQPDWEDAIDLERRTAYLPERLPASTELTDQQFENAGQGRNNYVFGNTTAPGVGSIPDPRRYSMGIPMGSYEELRALGLAK